MDQLLSSQSLEDSSSERGAHRAPVRRGRPGGIDATPRGASISEPVASAVDSHGEPRLIRFAAVMQRVSMGRTAVYGLIKAGKFPRPVKVGAASAWIDVEITRWIEELAAKRDTSR